VIRDAHCGSTWFVAKKLGWTDTPGYKETISGAHPPTLVPGVWTKILR